MALQRYLLILTCLFMSAAPAVSQQAGTPYVMERTEVRDMVSDEGASYRIFIQRPATEAPAAGYPVLYLLDGEDNFAVAATTSARFEKYAKDHGFEAGLIVGIGYAGKSRRSFDYTPASGLETDPRGRPVGGAKQFRDFITGKLRPAIEADFAVDARRQALFGHSYGGLFVLDTLLEDPSLFSTYLIASPSIWFADRIVLEKESALATKLEPLSPRMVVLTVGELESRAPLSLSGSADKGMSMREEVEGLGVRFEQLEGIRIHQRTLTGESHGSSVLPAIGAAVMYAFAGGPL
ncbi:alpha/beta hydrolase [Hyphomonas oceanitis]|uniref:alpha/beta hydrolase n=1 Tax=Hyphomonas oceanitis TaxID=81033 RepID=UPI00300227A3